MALGMIVKKSIIISAKKDHKQVLKQAFGKTRPEQIKPKHVYTYMDARGAKAKTGANRERSLLSSIFSYLIRWGVVEDNPCKMSKVSKKKQGIGMLKTGNMKRFYL